VKIEAGGRVKNWHEQRRGVRKIRESKCFELTDDGNKGEKILKKKLKNTAAWNAQGNGAINWRKVNGTG